MGSKIQIVYYSLGALGIIVTGFMGALKGYGRIVRFFTQLDSKVDNIGSDVNLVMTNHLPHIYSRLGRIEDNIETRDDSLSYTRRDRDDKRSGRLDSEHEGSGPTT